MGVLATSIGGTSNDDKEYKEYKDNTNCLISTEKTCHKFLLHSHYKRILLYVNGEGRVLDKYLYR
jgi:hypothetical protein